MDGLKQTCQCCYREIISPHIECSDEQGRRLSNDLCQVCGNPMNGEMNIEHASCSGKQYVGFRELINDNTANNNTANNNTANNNTANNNTANNNLLLIKRPFKENKVTIYPNDSAGAKRVADIFKKADNNTQIHPTGAIVSEKDAIKLNMLFIDARAKYEYDEGHIPGAVSMPLKDVLADETHLAVSLEAIKAGVGNKTKTVIYDNSFGAVASRVAWTLERAGLERAWLLNITYNVWLESGGKPSVEVVVPSTSAVFTPVENKDIYASINDVESADDNVVIIDNRERLNFLEKHIPGATNMPYHMLAEGKYILKNPKDLRRLFDNRSIDEKTKIITYCGSAGTLSGLAFYALRHAGFDTQRLYSKSLREWKDSKKPTETQGDAAYWDLSAE